MSDTSLDLRKSALLIVNMQPDFLPGGAMAVKGGDTIVAPLSDVLRLKLFGLYVATQAWHPDNHVSFASRHSATPLTSIELYGHRQMLWPDHCVQGSRGADLVPGPPWQRLSAIIRTGNDPEVASYSAFRDSWNPQSERPSTGLAGYLRERGTKSLFLCGLARDFSIRRSAEDAKEAGFETYVIWDLTRPVNRCDDAAVVDLLEQRGVRLVELADITA